MRIVSTLLASVLLAMTISASPMQRRQDDSDATTFAVVDVDAVWDDLPDPVFVAIPASLTSASASINTAAVAASISAVIATATVEAPIESSAPERRSFPKLLAKRADATDTGSTCTTKQQFGSYSGTVPDMDAAGFSSYKPFSDTAMNAKTPADYSATFINKNGSSMVTGYYQLVTLSSYSTEACAARCNANAKCQGFNLYFERDPGYAIDSNTCPDPKAVTNTKCVLLGYVPNAANAANYGQYRGKFHVVIAGSNGYAKNSYTPPPLDGYQPPHSLGTCVVNGDFHQYMTYHGLPGSTDYNDCATACNNVPAKTYPDGKLYGCEYFTAAPTYFRANNSYIGLNCAFYTANQTQFETTQRNCGSDKLYYSNTASYTKINYQAPIDWTTK